MAGADYKRCTNCGEIKPLTEFHNKKSSKDGLNTYCKICGCALASAWYKKNKERAKASNAAWRDTNQEKIKDLHRAWYERNKDRVAANTKVWREANIDRHRETERIGAKARYAKDPTKSRKNSKIYRERNLEAILAKERRYVLENPDKVKAASAAWRKANPEKVKTIAAAWEEANPGNRRALNANRRARVRGVDGSHTDEQIQLLYDLQKGKCACCSVTLKNKFHRDHIYPLILGGSNNIKNIQLLCVRCNCSKGPKDPIEHAQQIGRLL